jgi:hypothetical protein
VDSPGSRQGLLEGCPESGDEPSGSGATELITNYDLSPHSVSDTYCRHIVVHSAKPNYCTAAGVGPALHDGTSGNWRVHRLT